MIDRDGQTAMDLLDAATAALRDAQTPEGPPPQLVASTVEALRFSHTTPDTVRLNERKRLMFRIARYSSLAAAATVLAVLAGSFWLIDRNASMTFAEVIQHVKQAKSVSFVCKAKLGRKPERETKMFLQGDMARYEMHNVMIVILDTNQRKGLELHPSRKVAKKIDLVGQVPADGESFGSRIAATLQLVSRPGRFSPSS